MKVMLSRMKVMLSRMKVTLSRMKRSDCLIFLLLCSITYVAVLLWCYSPKEDELDSQNGHSNESKMDLKEFTTLQVVHQRKINDHDIYLLNEEHCKIPWTFFSQAHNYSIHDGIKNQKFDQCEQAPDFTQLKDNILKLTDSSLNASSCCVSEIYRKFADPNDHFRRGKCKKFNPETRSLDVSKKEFMEIQCKSEKTIYNFQVNVPLTGSLKRKADHWERQKEAGNERPPNIFLLVIDSTSRADLYRNLPKMTDFLLNQLGFVDFKGHHPLGEPTLVNAIPLLMGLRTNEFWGTYRLDIKEHWDSAPFIWKTFDYLNYITGYFEDLPSLGTFNYGGQRGFIHQPTDVYARPLTLAYSERVGSEPKKDPLSQCFGHRSIVEFLLDHQYNILTRFPTSPSFLIFWPCWPQHDYYASLHSQEDNLLKFFNKISQNKNILENTLFMVMADHSFKNGEYFTKFSEGLTERRTVPLLIRLPDKLRRENPSLLKNLLVNSESVTSHFDVYQTLIQMARMMDPYDQVERVGLHGQSLFKILPNRRSCSDASIPKSVCACHLRPPLVGRNFLNETIDPSLHLNGSEFFIPFT